MVTTCGGLSWSKHWGTRYKPCDMGTDTADREHCKFAFRNAINTLEFATNFCVARKHTADCRGSRSVSRCDKFAKTDNKLACHGNQYRKRRSRTKTLKPAANSLVTGSGAVDCSVDVIPAKRCMMSDGNREWCFRIFCCGYLARKTG